MPLYEFYQSTVTNSGSVLCLRALIVPLTKTHADVTASARLPSDLLRNINVTGCSLTSLSQQYRCLFCQRIIGMNVCLDTILPENNIQAVSRRLCRNGARVY